MDKVNKDDFKEVHEKCCGCGGACGTLNVSGQEDRNEEVDRLEHRVYPEKEMYDINSKVRAYSEYKPRLVNCEVEDGAFVAGQTYFKNSTFKKGAIVRGDDFIKNKEGATEEELKYAIKGEYVNFEETGMAHYHCEFNGTKENPVVIAGLAHGAKYEEGVQLYGIEFKCTKIGKESIICGVVVGVEIPEGKFVEFGKRVTSQKEADNLPNVKDMKVEDIEKNKKMAIEWQQKRREAKGENAADIRDVVEIKEGAFVEPSAQVEEFTKGKGVNIEVGEKSHISVDVFVKADAAKIGKGVNLQDGATMVAEKVSVGDLVDVPHLVQYFAAESIQIGKTFEGAEYDKLLAAVKEVGERLGRGEEVQAVELPEYVNFMGVGEIVNAKNVKVGQGVACGAGYKIDAKGQDVVLPDYFFLPHGFEGGLEELQAEILRQKFELGLKAHEPFTKDKNCIPGALAVFAYSVCYDNMRMADDNIKELQVKAA